MPIGATERPAVNVGETSTPGGRCPACGQPLFPWTEVARSGPRGPAAITLDRCEDCGLVIARGSDDPAVAAALDRVEMPNAASFQAGIGAESWSGLHPDRDPVVLTPRALELLAARHGRGPGRISYVVAPGMAAMLGTILNLLTFNRNFAAAALAGRLRPRNARYGAIGFGIDALVTVFTAIPVAILAVALEGIAILAGRGGVMRPVLSRSGRGTG